MAKKQTASAPAVDESLDDILEGEGAPDQDPPSPPQSVGRMIPMVGEKVGPALAVGAPMKDLLHVIRTLTEMGHPWDSGGPISAQTADDGISALMDAGWQVIYMQSLGIQPDGVAFLWVLGMPVESPTQPFREVKHITRTVGSLIDRGVTGFMADALVSSYLQEGWSLAHVSALGVGPTGIAMLWVLLR